MADYKKGKIYRLVCNTTGQQYIGSTIQSLSQRLGGHKASYKQFLEGKNTDKLSSFSILCENNFEMILIEEYPCENKNQLERQERHFIETTTCINKNIPSQTKEELKEHQQKYYQENKEKILKYQQKYYQENTAEIKEYNQKYLQENKEKIKERWQKYGEKYRQENKERIAELIKCECGVQYQRQNKARHFKSLKHKNWLATHDVQ